MRKLIAAILLAASPAFAADVDMVAKNGADVVRLSDSPCVHAGTLGQLQPHWRAKFKKARAQIGGKDFFACWIADENGVYILFEDGDEARVPMAMFKPDAGS